MKFYALRVTAITNPYLPSMGWRVGTWPVYSPKESQEPALGFGNFDTFNPSRTPELCQSLDEAQASLAAFARRIKGATVEIVTFQIV